MQENAIKHISNDVDLNVRRKCVKEDAQRSKVRDQYFRERTRRELYHNYSDHFDKLKQPRHSSSIDINMLNTNQLQPINENVYLSPIRVPHFYYL